MEQLLFNFDWDTPPTPIKEERRKSLPKMIKTIPSNLQNIDCSDSLENLFKKMGKTGLWLDKCAEYCLYKNHLSFISRKRTANSIFANIFAKNDDGNLKQLVATFVYFDENGTMWTNKINMFFDDEVPTWRRYRQYEHENFLCTKYQMGEWKALKQTKLMPNVTILQTKNELFNILQKVNPYSAEWARKMGVDPQNLLMAPHIETLYKADFRFVQNFFSFQNLDEESCVLFNRLCQVGTKPKNIFKTSKTIYTILKNETKMEVWDCYRRLDKTGKIKSDNVEVIYNQGFDIKDLEHINSILAKRYNGKPVFTWNTLINYLGRLDTFEAIERKEAFMLLNDYLSMCNTLQMEPRIDGDSLKREHDIAARNCRNMRNEILSRKMKENCEKMKKYNYSENIYFIRAIQSYDDLLDEATQQHNCVASYGQRIANGQSYIYVMREVAHPEKSLITIELSPNGDTIRQKFLAYNKAIHNKSQSEFIERWTKFCKKNR